MANEMLTTGLGDVQTTEVLANLVFLLAAERAPLIGHPAFAYAGSVNARGSNVIKVPHAGLMGVDLPSATAAENTSVANTAFTDGSTQVTVARASLAREISDLARLIDANGLFNAGQFAMDAVIGAEQYLISQICDAIDGFTTVVGSSGSDFTYEQFLDAKATLEGANVAGDGLIWVGHSRQWNDLRSDMYLNSGGALQMDPESIAANKLVGSGYQGRHAGVDIFVTNRVNTADAGANRAGAMFGRGGLAWGSGAVPVEDPANQFSLQAGPVQLLFERDRTAREAETAWIMHMYTGVSKAIDAFGVTVKTDA